jgi:hypothetical protein
MSDLDAGISADPHADQNRVMEKDKSVAKETKRNVAICPCIDSMPNLEQRNQNAPSAKSYFDFFGGT